MGGIGYRNRCVGGIGVGGFRVGGRGGKVLVAVYDVHACIELVCFSIQAHTVS